MNKKVIGERAEACVIGELARFGIDIAIPLTDNLPYDFIALTPQKLFRVQVKSSAQELSGATCFDLTSNNWYAKKVKKYSSKDCDVVACYDLRRYQTYLLLPKDFTDRKTITIRFTDAKNGQKYKSHKHEDFVMNDQRIRSVFQVEPTTLCCLSKTPALHVLCCQKCNTTFESRNKNQKYCGTECSSKSQKKKEDVPEILLAAMVSSLGYTATGKHFGVSDNTIRKWMEANTLFPSAAIPHFIMDAQKAITSECRSLTSLSQQAVFSAMKSIPAACIKEAQKTQGIISEIVKQCVIHSE